MATTNNRRTICMSHTIHTFCASNAFFPFNSIMRRFANSSFSTYKPTCIRHAPHIVPSKLFFLHFLSVFVTKNLFGSAIFYLPQYAHAHTHNAYTFLGISNYYCSCCRYCCELMSYIPLFAALSLAFSLSMHFSIVAFVCVVYSLCASENCCVRIPKNFMIFFQSSLEEGIF